MCDDVMRLAFISIRLTDQEMNSQNYLQHSANGCNDKEYS